MTLTRRSDDASYASAVYLSRRLITRRRGVTLLSFYGN